MFVASCATEQLSKVPPQMLYLVFHTDMHKTSLLISPVRMSLPLPKKTILLNEFFKDILALGVKLGEAVQAYWCSGKC